jgi:hypothetical protein
MRTRIEICSPPDRESLVAAIMLGEEQLAEINQESGSLVLEIYPRRDGTPWILSLHDAIEALAAAKARMVAGAE